MKILQRSIFEIFEQVSKRLHIAKTLSQGTIIVQIFELVVPGQLLVSFHRLLQVHRGGQNRPITIRKKPCHPAEDPHCTISSEYKISTS